MNHCPKIEIMQIKWDRKKLKKTSNLIGRREYTLTKRRLDVGFLVGFCF